MNMDSRFFILLQRYKDFLKLGNITKNILRTKLDGVINDELALDVWERALDLELGPKEDVFLLEKMAQVYKRIGDEATSLICMEEARKISQNIK